MAVAVSSAVLTTLLVMATRVEGTATSSGMFDLQPDLHGMVNDDVLLHSHYGRSDLDCANACLLNELCAAFTASPMEGSASQLLACRGYSARWTMAVPSALTAVDGRRTYDIDRCASGWLGCACHNHDGCPGSAQNAECIAEVNQFLCTPGFYYSLSQDDCVPECQLQDLQPSFVRYPLRAIRNNNRLTILGTSEAVCRETCVLDAECRTFDWKARASKCNIQYVDALDPSIEYIIINSSDHHQRTCV